MTKYTSQVTSLPHISNIETVDFSTSIIAPFYTPFNASRILSAMAARAAGLDAFPCPPFAEWISVAPLPPSPPPASPSSPSRMYTSKFPVTLGINPINILSMLSKTSIESPNSCFR